MMRVFLMKVVFLMKWVFDEILFLMKVVLLILHFTLPRVRVGGFTPRAYELLKSGMQP